MATHIGGMPPVYLPTAARSESISNGGVAASRPFGSKGATVSADPFRKAEAEAKKTFMGFLESLGESGEYAKLTSLTGT